MTRLNYEMKTKLWHKKAKIWYTKPQLWQSINYEIKSHKSESTLWDN